VREMSRSGPSAKWYWIALILAFVLRAGLVVTTDPSKVFTRWSNVGDASLYDRFGWNLASEGVLGTGDRPSGFIMPGYPVFLAGAYLVTGHVPGMIRWLQVLLGIATVAAIAHLGRRLAGPAAGAVAALVAAGYPFLIYFVPELLTETLFIAAFVGMVVTAMELGRSPRLSHGVLHGVWLTVAFMTRPVPLVLEPGVLLLAQPWKREGRRTRLAGLAAGFLIVAACWGAWIARNYRVFDKLVPFDTHGGFMLYTSQLISRGVPHEEVVRRTRAELGYYRGDIENGTLPGGPQGELDADKRAAEKAREFAQADPRAALMLIPHNLGSLWLNLDFEEVGRQKSRLGWAGLVGVVAYVPVLLLGLLGLMRLWRTQRVTFLGLAWILIGTSLLFGLTHGGKRYRVATIDPILIALAGAETSRWLPRLTRSNGPRSG